MEIVRKSLVMVQLYKNGMAQSAMKQVYWKLPCMALVLHTKIERITKPEPGQTVS
jgi:hypothetical protein